jgi:hypothetical protein
LPKQRQTEDWQNLENPQVLLGWYHRGVRHFLKATGPHGRGHPRFGLTFKSLLLGYAFSIISKGHRPCDSP